jgi:hypothetical protein
MILVQPNLPANLNPFDRATGGKESSWLARWETFAVTVKFYMDA